jgi:hypothetical protein
MFLGVFRPPLTALWRESHATSALLAGLAASVPAAIVSAALFFAADFLHRRPPGTTLLTVGAVGGATTWGGALAVHLAVSALFGGIFGLLVAFTAHHIAPVAGAAWGAFYGLLVWLVWFVLILPWVERDLAVQTRTGLLWHLVYGATLGFFFHYARVGERRRHRVNASRPPSAGISPRLH